jgi:hypothetical protein
MSEVLACSPVPASAFGHGGFSSDSFLAFAAFHDGTIRFQGRPGGWME